MSSKETDLKEKFRVALNSTAKVIADDFEVNRKNQENKKTKDFLSLDIDNISPKIKLEVQRRLRSEFGE